jgi:hypothetical protein
MTSTSARLAAAALAAFLIAAGTLRAQVRDAGGSAPRPTAGSRVAGRVVDAVDPSQPIRRAIVTIAGSGLANGRSAVTDDNGGFVFAGVPSGTFTISAARQGYLKATYGAARPGRPGTAIPVKTGADVTDVVLPMTHGSAIAGTLRDVAGDPAPGMRIEAIRLSHTAGGTQGEMVGSTGTDDRGQFRIFGLPAGDYVLAATPAAIIGGLGEIGMPSEAEVDAIFASLGRRGSTPPPAPGQPAAPSHPPLKDYAMPATYFPGVTQSSDAGVITLGINDSRENSDFAFQMSHAAAVDGVVVPVRGQSVPQVSISIIGSGPSLPVFGGSHGAGPSLTQRGSDHSFHVANVPPGHYRLLARTFGAPGTPTQIMSSGGTLPTTFDSSNVQWAIAEVDLGGDDISGVTLALQPALKFTGRLAFEATTHQAPADASGVRIALLPIVESEDGSPATISGKLNRDGTFEFPALLPGRFRLSVTASSEWLARSAVVADKDILDGGLTITNADVANAVVTLSDKRASIGGTLSTAAGRPAPDYFIVAYATDHTMWRSPSRRVVFSRPATDGSFEVRDLPPGSYYLAALTDVDPSDLNDPAFLESLVPASLSVTVEDGKKTTQSIKIGK